MSGASVWREGGDSRAALQAAGGAVIGGLGGGAFGAVGGAAGAAISSKLADQTKAAADAVTDATGSSLIGNISGNILSGLAGGLVGGSAGAAMASNVNLYNQSMDTEAAAKDARVKSIVAQALGNPPDFNSVPLGTLIDQFMGKVKSGAQAKMSESPSALAAQGIANGLAAGVGIGGGKPPAQSPGAVLVDGAGQALAGGTSSSASVAGYGDGYSTLNVQDNKAKGDAFENEKADAARTQYPEVGQQITIKTSDGTRTRVDIMTRDSGGNIGCIECKSLDTAPLTKNQATAFPLVENQGAVILGKGKPGFEGGTVIPPTKVEIVRPPSK